MASTYIYRDCDATASSGYTSKFTISAWVKRGTLGEQGIFMQRKISHVSQSRIRLRFTSADRLGMDFKDSSSNDDSSFETNALFRDTNAWYHIVFSFDSTQSTEADRLKVWVNGVNMRNDGGGFSSINEASNGFGALFSSAARSMLGITTNNSNVDSMFDGIMSHVHFTYDYTYDASTFGSTDSTTGEWKINTSPTIANYGSQGFFVLKDGNSATDQSGQSNNMTIDGGTLTKTEDCPSNVFATLNPNYQSTFHSTSRATLANGNTKWTATNNNTSQNGILSTLGASSGKWYLEAKWKGTYDASLGVAKEDFGMMTAGTGGLESAGWYGMNTNVSSTGGSGMAWYSNNSATGDRGNTISTNDIIMMAIDLDNSKLYFGKNGTWEESGDPTSGATGTGATSTLASNTTYIVACGNYGYSYANSWEFNFGNGYFGTTAVSSAGTNASGIGIFEYDVPTGYTALSTKGLNE